MKLNTLKALYVDGVRDLYSAETQLHKALAKMRKGATSEPLREALVLQIEQTQVHMTRLEWICEVMGVSPKGKHCKGMEGLMAESAELLDKDADADVMDAGLISSAQHAEHYQMAGYGTVRTYATLLGWDAQAATLQTTLLEEREADQALTALALTVNLDAMDREESRAHEETSEALQSMHL